MAPQRGQFVPDRILAEHIGGQGRLAPPDKVYLSGVSAVISTGDNQVKVSDEFRHFVAEKYGADFEPQCDFYSTESQATKMHQSWNSRYAGTVIQTGWTRKPTAADAPKPQTTYSNK